MTSRERILAVLGGGKPDHVPLTTWCFGLKAPEPLRWSGEDGGRPFWYSLRMEHLHTLPHPWTLEDDFKRALAWRQAGIDDVLDVSIPWSFAPGVSWTEKLLPKGVLDASYEVFTREYSTPKGVYRHSVRKTAEDIKDGWVIQPDGIPPFEDFNIPRAVRHLVTGAEDVEIVPFVYAPPDEKALGWINRRMTEVDDFAGKNGFPVQVWSAFGMDAAVWLAGTEGAIMLAMDHPDVFRKLMDYIFETDYARTEAALAHGGTDIVVMRGWYSSTDFWSPGLFRTFVYPYIEKLARYVHEKGKKFAYVMTTGVEILGESLADAGVDLLYFADPVQDRYPVESAKKLSGRMAIAGGTNAVSLHTLDRKRIADEVRLAVKTLGPAGRFILHPVDALFPDTPWEGVEILIDEWKKALV